MFNFFLTDLCFLLDRDGECAFFWTTLISLGRRICTLLTMVNFPGVGHLNWKDDRSSNPPPLPGLPPQQLNIDRCIIIKELKVKTSFKNWIESPEISYSKICSFAVTAHEPSIFSGQRDWIWAKLINFWAFVIQTERQKISLYKTKSSNTSLN